MNETPSGQYDSGYDDLSNQETQDSNLKAREAAQEVSIEERGLVSEEVNKELTADLESRVKEKLPGIEGDGSIEGGGYQMKAAVQEESFEFLKLVAEKIKNPEEFKKNFLDHGKDNNNLNEDQREEILSILEQNIKKRGLAETVLREKLPIAETIAEREGKNKGFDRFFDTDISLTPVSSFLEDPALADILLIEDDWLPEDISKEKAAALKTELCRNLFFEEKPVNEENFKEAYAKLLEIRKELKNKDIEIINGRNIVVLAAPERTDDGSEYRFAKDATISSIIDKGGELPDERFIGAKDEKDIDALNRAKKEALKQIVDCPPPMTFCFMGHGGTDAIYLAGGKNPSAESDPNLKITAKEFSQALIARYENDSDKSNKMPIFIGASEYNQVAYGQDSNPHGSEFLKTTLSGKRSTLGNLVDSDLNQKETNPSTYIPNGKDLAQRDIFIFAQCFNSTFIRKIINKLKSSGMGNVMQLAENTEESSGSMTT